MNCWKLVDTEESTSLYPYLSPLRKMNPLTPPSSNRGNLNIFLKKNTSKISNLNANSISYVSSNFKFSPNLIQVVILKFKFSRPFQSKHPSLDLNFSMLRISQTPVVGIWRRSKIRKRIVMSSLWKKNTFYNKLKILKYSRNCISQHTLIPWSLNKYDIP